MGGGSLDRPELEKCLDRLETGDTLVVWRLDRRGRSIRNLLQIVDRLDKSGINFISLKENFDHEHSRRQARLSLLRGVDAI